MKLKKGDNVIIVSGKDKGKKGKILKVFKDENKILVEGVNMRKRHTKPTKQGQKGQIIDKNTPIDASNAMFFDSKSGKGTRIGMDIKGDKKTRIAKKSGAKI